MSKSTARPPSLLVNGYPSPFPVTKQPWCKSGRLTPIKCRVKIAWSYTFTLPYTFLYKRTTPPHSSLSRERTAKLQSGSCSQIPTEQISDKGTCSVCESLEMHERLWLERFKEKDNLGKLGVNTKSAGVWLRI